MQYTKPAPIQGVYHNQFTDGQVTGLADRKISQQTCQFFGVKTVSSGDQIVKHIYPYYDESGAHVANKVRQVQNKGFKLTFTDGNKLTLLSKLVLTKQLCLW